MNDPKVVDLADQRAALKRNPRMQILSKPKLPVWAVAWAVLFVIAAVGYFGMRPPTVPSPVLAGVSNYDGGIPSCGMIRRTCLVDGDTGWQDGVKWRLTNVDTPEIDGACPNERELAKKALARLGSLMSTGYAISWRGRQDQYKRELVSVRTKDGRDVGEVLSADGLARPWPNKGNVWCER